MLDLQSPRWLDLKAHITELPPPAQCVAEWKSSIGTDEEAAAYDRLWNQYLHQLTILSCAWAVVPHVVSMIRAMEPSKQLDYLSDIAHVELNRLTREEAAAAVEGVQREWPAALRDHMVEATRDRFPELPDDLAADYLSALATAKALAVALLANRWKPYDFARVLGVLSALHAPGEDHLARALLQPDGLWIEASYENKASISTLLSDQDDDDDG